jgi:hypothetical protein
MKPIRIGRRRKVFKQGNAHISFTGKKVTAHAGMALVARAFDAYQIGEKLDPITAHLDIGCQHTTSKILQQLIALRILGGEAVSDTAVMDETALKAMFDWDTVAHQSTFGRRLKLMSWQDNLALETIVTELSQRVRKSGKLLLAIDSTVDTVFGEKIQGAERGYNPHKPGRSSYHPLLAVDIASRSVVDGYLRPGSCASNDGLDGFIRKIAAEAGRPSDDLIFRLDKGLTSGNALDTLEALHTGYVAKVKLTANVMGHISRIKKWRSIGNGHFAANFRCQLTGWSRSRRFCVIERHIEPKKPDCPYQAYQLFTAEHAGQCRQTQQAALGKNQAGPSTAVDFLLLDGLVGLAPEK